MRPEVRRNINYAMISRCQDNGKDHASDYHLLYKRSIWTYLNLRNFGITLAFLLSALALYGLFHR